MMTAALVATSGELADFKESLDFRGFPFRQKQERHTVTGQCAALWWVFA